MLASNLLLALFALPLAALAQDAQSSDAPADNSAPADNGAPAADATQGAASPSKSNVGANIGNTGMGSSGNQTEDWRAAHFTAPSVEYFWVDQIENTAVWTPYNEPVDLIIFNSKPEIFSGNKTIASNIPAGTGRWKGMITGFTPGNNYILTLAPVSDRSRKVGQTNGFWIKRAFTFPIEVPEDAANTAVATGNANGAVADSTGAGNTTAPTQTGATESASTSAPGGSADASSTAGSAPASQSSAAASGMAVSGLALVGALALAIAL